MIDSRDIDVNDDMRQVVIVSWGKSPGRVVGVIRQFLGMEIAAVKELKDRERPVVTSGSMLEIYGLITALEEAGAEIELRTV